jgi:hypothetical protein
MSNRFSSHVGVIYPDSDSSRHVPIFMHVVECTAYDVGLYHGMLCVLDVESHR